MIGRRLLLAGSALGAVGALTLRRAPAAGTQPFAVQHSDAEWRTRLSPAAYAVLRQADTEAPYSSPLLQEHRRGVFTCAGCDLAAFDAATKFDSGTGWPSFFQALPHGVATSNDESLMMERTEVHCSRCGGHLGHVFNDGPAPTGLRYCMNGVALGFKAAVA